MRFEAVRELQKDEQAHELRVLEKKLEFERQIAQSRGRGGGSQHTFPGGSMFGLGLSDSGMPISSGSQGMFDFQGGAGQG